MGFLLLVYTALLGRWGSSCWSTLLCWVDGVPPVGLHPSILHCIMAQITRYIQIGLFMLPQLVLFAMYAPVGPVYKVCPSLSCLQGMPQSVLFAMYATLGPVCKVCPSRSCLQSIPQSVLFATYSLVGPVCNVYPSWFSFPDYPPGDRPVTMQNVGLSIVRPRIRIISLLFQNWQFCSPHSTV